MAIAAQSFGQKRGLPGKFSGSFEIWLFSVFLYVIFCMVFPNFTLTTTIFFLFKFLTHLCLTKPMKLKFFMPNTLIICTYLHNYDYKKQGYPTRRSPPKHFLYRSEFFYKSTYFQTTRLLSKEYV